MHGVERSIEHRIIDLLSFFPAVALLGPRQCGKTTLALQIGDKLGDTVYLDLENVTDLAKLEDSAGYLSPLADKLVILDEVQNRPDLFPELRGLIDEGRRSGHGSGRFLFLGSASHELLRQSGESLAGRIAYLELTPFRLHELAAGDLDRLWVRGGFPDSFLAPSDAMSRERRRNFVDTYLARDLGQLGKTGPLPAMRDLITMLAHLQGSILNVSSLAAAHEFSRVAVGEYLDLFEQTFVIRRLKPYFANIGKRLAKRPKVYLRDTGILHYLLGIDSEDDLRGHPGRGASWEIFVIEEIISLLPDWQPHFYRTSQGAEFDLVMLRGGKKLAFEIKVATNPVLTKGFHEARRDVAPDEVFVISRTDRSWTTSDGIRYVIVPELPEMLAEFK